MTIVELEGQYVVRTLTVSMVVAGLPVVTVPLTEIGGGMTDAGRDVAGAQVVVITSVQGQSVMVRVMASLTV